MSRHTATRLLGTYSLDGTRHRIELVARHGRALVVDRPDDDGPIGVVAELYPDEGERQALAVLHQGAYLQRAQAGEPGLCCVLDDDHDEAAARGRAA